MTSKKRRQRGSRTHGGGSHKNRRACGSRAVAVSCRTAEGVAEEDGDGYRIDARDVVEDGHEVDAVKVLGGGQVRTELTVVADAFSDGARELIEDAGGEATLTERGEERKAQREADTSTNEEQKEDA